MKKIWSLFENSKRVQFVYLSGLLSLNTVLEAFSISLLVPIIVSLSDNNFFELYPKFSMIMSYFQNKLSLNLFDTTILLFVITILFKNLFQVYINYKDAFLNTTLSEETSQKLLRQILLKDYSYHLKNKSSDLITKVRIETKNFAAAIFSLINILSDIILVIGLSILLLALTFKVTLSIIVVSLILSIFFLKIFQKFISRSSLDRQNLEFKKSFLVQENIQGIREIIISNIFNQINDSYKKISDAYARCTAKFDLLQKFPKVYFELFTLLALAIGLYVTINSQNFIRIEFILPTLGLYAACAFKILPAVNRLVSFIQRYKFVYPAVDQIYDQLKDSSNKFINQHKINIQKVEIKNLNFWYTNESKKIFENVNFKINRGDKILIGGESGSGKSTLLDLITGLQNPKSGIIKLNDKEEINKNKSIINSLGYVSQKIFIFNKSLRYNITLDENKERFNHDKFHKSLEKACVDFFDKEKIDLPLGEFGSLLSGGQKQRIMIARALYKSENFLIMDEPTSSLDNLTSNLIIKNLIEDKDLTLIMVSHDKSFSQLFEKIYEIKNSKIMEIKNGKK
tara:strand:+ start:383 stop:2089 length:1707 start_codon:yes stop_codon:yes gene_type:complete